MIAKTKISDKLRISDLYNDVILKISEFLTDKEKITLTMASQSLDKLKYKTVYREKLHINKIKYLSYFDRFECIEIWNAEYRYPKSIKNIYFFALNGNVPSYVTHLTFGSYFNQLTDNCIPTSVTHLSFGAYFNKSIKGCIPASVTHLAFGLNFNQPIKDNIPSSVTHLTFGLNFDQPIKDHIPSSVTYLTLDRRCDKYIDDEIRSMINIILIDCCPNPKMMLPPWDPESITDMSLLHPI